MNDDELQRAWHFKQLKWSLQALARAGAPQPTPLPEESTPAGTALGSGHGAGPFKRLRWSLQALARAGAPQPTLFPEESNPDDLAFGFDHWAGLVQDAYGAGRPRAEGRVG